LLLHFDLLFIFIQVLAGLLDDYIVLLFVRIEGASKALMVELLLENVAIG